MAEEVKDWLPAAIAVLVIFFFLLLTCGIVALLFLIPQPASVGPSQPNQTGPPGNATPPPGNATGQNVSGEDLALWDLITAENVEDACLRRARDEAGDSAELVYGCDCTESASEGRKTYSCDIETASPFTKYFANVDCFLDGAACTVETNYGTQTVSFAELAEWYGK